MLGLQHYDLVKEGKLKEPEWMKAFHVHWKEEKKGEWSIKKFKVELDMTNLRLMRDYRGCFPGKYTMLRHNRYGIVMSDTTAEIGDHYEAWRRANGRVLIHGLGLGCFLQACLSKSSVDHVDVVEIDKDVISLIAPHFKKDKRVVIHHDDCFTKKWSKDAYWNVIWHDVWNNICSNNKKEMEKLHRKFARKCDWQDSWSKEYLKAIA